MSSSPDMPDATLDQARSRQTRKRTQLGKAHKIDKPKSPESTTTTTMFCSKKCALILSALLSTSNAVITKKSDIVVEKIHGGAAGHTAVRGSGEAKGYRNTNSGQRNTNGGKCGADTTHFLFEIDVGAHGDEVSCDFRLANAAEALYSDGGFADGEVRLYEVCLPKTDGECYELTIHNSKGGGLKDPYNGVEPYIAVIFGRGSYVDLPTFEDTFTMEFC